MSLRRTLISSGIVVVIIAAFSSVTTVAGAETTEPSTTDLAWFWEDAQSSSQTTPVGDVTVQTPNPFCPTNPGSGLGDVSGGRSCAEDVLPLWVRSADYETPYMMSAVAFDFSLIPVGSEVKEFTVTFLEDEGGCQQSDAGDPQKCRATDQINAEKQTIQACVATQIIGGGESRPLKELPNHDCAGAATATRKEVKNDDEADPTDTDPDHVWKFDLTTAAQQWVETFSVATGVVLRPIEAQKAPDQQDDWRVVLAGPRFTGGVVTRLVYEPGDLSTTPIPTTPIDSGTTGSTDFGTTPIGSSGSLDPGGSSELPGTETPEVGAPTDTTDDGAVDVAGDEPANAVESFPGYMWLAILAGLAGFLLVRSIVLETVTGIRPNGVLAQIRNINAQRRGASIEAAETGAFAAIGTAATRVFGGLGRLASNTVNRFKRG